MNRKELAVEVCKNEGLKKQVNVAQVAEVLKCALDVMASLPAGDLAGLLRRRPKRKS